MASKKRTTLHSMFWDKEACKHAQPGKHYIVEHVKNPVLSTIPWINDKYSIWRQITLLIDDKFFTLGCQRFVKNKQSNSDWYISADQFSPEFKTIPEGLKWLQDKIIKGTCGDGSGGYHIRISQQPRKHEVWI